MTNKNYFLFLLTVSLFLISCNETGKNKVAGHSISKNLKGTFSSTVSDTLIHSASEFKIAEPICVDYSEASSVSPSEESYDDYTQRRLNYSKDKKRLIKKFVKQHLFLNADSVSVQNIWSGDTLETVSIESYLAGKNYYQLDTVLKTSQFTGITYGETGDEGSQKYLCTFDKSGKLISKISIAFFMHSGSSTGDDGSRIPWYAEKKGCIEKDLTINFISQIHIDKKYKIQTSGQIVEIR